MASISSFPSSAWERTGAKLCFASAHYGKQSFPPLRSQAELGNERLSNRHKIVMVQERLHQVGPRPQHAVRLLLFLDDFLQLLQRRGAFLLLLRRRRRAQDGLEGGAGELGIRLRADSPGDLLRGGQG